MARPALDPLLHRPSVMYLSPAVMLARLFALNGAPQQFLLAVGLFPTFISVAMPHEVH